MYYTDAWLSGCTRKSGSKLTIFAADFFTKAPSSFSTQPTAVAASVMDQAAGYRI